MTSMQAPFVLTLYKPEMGNDIETGVGPSVKEGVELVMALPSHKGEVLAISHVLLKGYIQGVSC